MFYYASLQPKIYKLKVISRTQDHQREDMIHNRTVKIQFPVAVVTRQTEMRHWETLSDWDFCSEYMGGYLTAVLSLGHSEWDGSLRSHGSQWPHNKLLQPAASVPYSHNQQLQVARGMKSVHDQELAWILACNNEEKEDETEYCSSLPCIQNSSSGVNISGKSNFPVFLLFLFSFFFFII